MNTFFGHIQNHRVRPTPYPKSVGVWLSGYFPHSSTWVHAGGPAEECCNPATYHSGPRSSRDNHPFWWVAGI